MEKWGLYEKNWIEILKVILLLYVIIALLSKDRLSHFAAVRVRGSPIINICHWRARSPVFGLFRVLESGLLVPQPSGPRSVDTFTSAVRPVFLADCLLSVQVTLSNLKLNYFFLWFFCLSGDIGGNMGLFLGCSLMTLFEFVDLVWNFLDSRTNRAKSIPEERKDDGSVWSKNHERKFVNSFWNLLKISLFREYAIIP